MKVKNAHISDPRYVAIDFRPRRFGHLARPSEALEFATSTGSANVDAVGIVRRGTLEPTRRYGFMLGAVGTQRNVELLPPTPADVAVLARLRPVAAAALRAWVPVGASRQETLVAIERKLQNRDTNTPSPRPTPYCADPIVDFLENPKGNCEYFATAMALIVRQAGIPTRLVAGYRVGEHNALGDHWIVRKKNAHSWVEVWIDDDSAEPVGGSAARRGHWARFDPTPMTELPQHETHELEGAQALTDFLGSLWRRVEGWLAERTVKELVPVVVFGTIVFALVPW